MVEERANGGERRMVGGGAAEAAMVSESARGE